MLVEIHKLNIGKVMAPWYIDVTYSKLKSNMYRDCDCLYLRRQLDLCEGYARVNINSYSAVIAAVVVTFFRD